MTDRRTQTPHADHCGSLLRPQELRSARAAHALGRMGEDELRGIEDKAILRALELQHQVGLRIYSDGEFRRKFFHEALESAAEGVADAGPDFERFPLLPLPISPPIRRSRASTPSSQTSCVRVDASRRMR